jgi:hypothetical protein
MERVVSALASLGITGLLVVVIAGTTGYAGAAAITAALASFGPGGMVGGIVCFALVALTMNAVAIYGWKSVEGAIINRWLSEGKSKDDTLAQFQRLPVSGSYKDHVYRLLFDGEKS